MEPPADGRARIRHVVDAISARFARAGVDDTWRLASEYGYLRAAFVEAGCRRLEEACDAPAWLQFNVSLSRDRDHWQKFMARDLGTVFARWLASGAVEHIWFVQKGSAFRWRFIGVDADLRPAIESLFARLAAEDVIAGWAPAPYDAEAFQFGGSEGLDLAHRFFTIDTMALLRYRTCDDAGDAPITAQDFSLLLLDSVLRGCVGDESELWDVWCKMTLTGRLPFGPCAGDDAIQTAAARIRRRMLPMLRRPEIATAQMQPGQRLVYDGFAAHAPALAERARYLAESGRLLWGLREILPFWVIFHWNRFGFDEKSQRKMALLMTHVLNPKIGELD